MANEGTTGANYTNTCITKADHFNEIESIFESRNEAGQDEQINLEESNMNEHETIFSMKKRTKKRTKYGFFPDTY